MKKGQTEILGVAIIVLILIIGGVVLIMMNAERNVSDSGSYVDPELASSFLNTLMNTKTEKNMVVSDVIRHCYKQDDWCGTVSCCDYAHGTMKNALDETLGKWKRSYTLKIGDGNLIRQIPEDSACTDRSEQEAPGYFYISNTNPLIVVQLRICKTFK